MSVVREHAQWHRILLPCHSPLSLGTRAVPVPLHKQTIFSRVSFTPKKTGFIKESLFLLCQPWIGRTVWGYYWKDTTNNISRVSEIGGLEVKLRNEVKHHPLDLKCYLNLVLPSTRRRWMIMVCSCFELGKSLPYSREIHPSFWIIFNFSL